MHSIATLLTIFVSVAYAQFNQLPRTASGGDIRPFQIQVAEEKVRDMETLIRLSPISKPTYENLMTDGSLGLSREWMVETKKHWMNNFKWREHEKYINSFPHFMSTIQDDDGSKYDMHFMALLSEKPNAIPIVILHGWPGSFLEFLGVFGEMKKRYQASDLPYHLIAPSLLGYGFTSDPPKNKDWHVADNARIVNKLMVHLGFNSYIAQGGDLGSFTAQMLANNHQECKAIHVNFLPSVPGIGGILTFPSAREIEGLGQMARFILNGSAYSSEQATQPATIGLTLAASPIALLAWIGEKFVYWNDKQIPIDEILRSISLYWLTETYPTSIYAYRDNMAQFAMTRIKKPFGYTWNPKEVIPVPKGWASDRGNMIWFKAAEHGGHFAAMENPESFTKDLEDFVSQAWPKVSV